MKMSTIQRINRVMKFYELRGQNRERVNNVKRNYLKQKYEK